MAVSHYKIFNNWLFDGLINTPFPIPKVDDKGNEIIPDLMKYNSPITHTNVLRMFLRNGTLNHYLNTYFNNINLRYLPKYEFFIFIKKAVIDFRIKQQDITYYPYKHKDKLFEKLRVKLPLLKNEDIELLCDIIEDSPKRESVYSALNIEKPAQKKSKKKIIRGLSMENYLDEHFTIVNVE